MLYLHMDEDFYLKIKRKFEAGKIESFSDMYAFVQNKKKFSLQTNTTPERLKRILANVGTMQFEDIRHFAQAIDVDDITILLTFYADYLASFDQEGPHSQEYTP
jgi:hypothetical protein